MKKPPSRAHALHELKLAEKRERRKRQRQDDERKYLTATQVQNCYGVSDMTLHRWLKTPALGFPPPTFTINKYRYWAEATLDEWDLQRIARTANPSEAA